MPRLQHFLSGLCLIFFTLPMLAQTGSSLPASGLRQKTVVWQGDTLHIDTLFLLPHSLHIAGVPDSAILMFPEKSSVWIRGARRGDSLRLQYRVLAMDLSRRSFHKDRGLVDSLVMLTNLGGRDVGADNSFVSYRQLEISGSYGRSLSIGNRQDAVLNSQLNLQVAGYIADSVRIEAAIADNTIPVQPEGNTQNLQEFDQIYIRLSKGRHLLQIGDYNLEKPKGYFLNFYKRVQGLYYQTGFNWNARTLQTAGVSGSVAKGQFARNIFGGGEGNQGPYKLTGNNGEQFFIVLANTERVYVNGLLQERGENADYIINYNTAEVRFMPRRLITKDSRIQVEFEYQDRNYLNSLVYAWTELQAGPRWNFRVNAYSNQDARNQNYQQTLSGDQKRFLGVVGDSIQNALYPVITLDTFAANKILYKIVDTVFAGLPYDSVFVYSTNPDSARYNLSFAFVGEGRGDYVISASTANGRVYDWVPPLGGRRQGAYAPVQLIITPKMQQVFTFAATHLIDTFKSVTAEVALSNYDPNLFSTAGNSQHLGGAGRVRYNEQRAFGKKDSLTGVQPWRWEAEASGEYVQDRFRAIAPYRNVEFNRDWNVPYTVEGKPDERLAGVFARLSHARAGAISYSGGYYDRTKTYTGIRNVLGYAYDRGRWYGGATGNLLQATDTFSNVRYFRPSAYLEYRMKKKLPVATGLRYDGEHNDARTLGTDSLRPYAFAFDVASAYIRTQEGQRTRFSLAHTLRRDASPVGTAFVQQNHSQTTDLRLGLAQWADYHITFTGSYRKLIIDDTTVARLKPEETLLARLEYTGSLLHRALQLQSLYEVGSGQEQRRSYTYVEVPAGQGLYFWNDYNGDGVQQANEFEVAQFPDQKRFIRIITLTNEYVKVNYVNYNQSIVFEPASFFREPPKKGLRKFISRFADQASLQVANRLLADAGGNAYNPFSDALDDAAIITTSSSLSNTLYYNRSSAIWGIDYSYLRNTAKQLLTYGVEGQTNRQHTGKIRWNMTPSFTLNIVGRSARRAYESALDDGRSYRIHGYGGEPSLTWLHRSKLRLTGGVRYEDRRNEQAFGGEKALINSANLEFRYAQPGSGAILLRGTYSGIRYTGTTNTSVAFNLLDALQPGDNFLWSATWDRRVSKGIEIALEYEGRKPGGNVVVHTGRMSIRAIL